MLRPITVFASNVDCHTRNGPDRLGTVSACLAAGWDKDPLSFSKDLIGQAELPIHAMLVQAWNQYQTYLEWHSEEFEEATAGSGGAHHHRDLDSDAKAEQATMGRRRLVSHGLAAAIPAERVPLLQLRADTCQLHADTCSAAAAARRTTASSV